MNAFKLAGALGLTFLACAAAAETSASHDSSATLRASAGGSDLFSRAADGSVEFAALPDPASAAGAAAARPNSVSRFERAAARPHAEVPVAAVSAGRTPLDGLPVRRDPFAAAGLIGGGLLLAIGAMLLQHSGPSGLAETVAAPASYGFDPVISALATRDARAPAPAPALAAAEEMRPAVAATEISPARPAARLAEPFVDTRMPVGTWRAISWQEQAVIESWARSREKALGQASLEQWIDRHPAAGVDAGGLKAKLARA
jgi:hypothetical protein